VTTAQQTFAITASVAILVGVLELVRRRRLREEYAWLWLLTGTVMLVLCGWYAALEWLTAAIGAVLPTTTLFLFALLFLLAISVHFSTVLSRLTDQMRRLTQELALLRAEAPPPSDHDPGAEREP